MKTLEFTATICTVLGFYLISQNILLWGFVISLMANVFWICWASRLPARGILVVNALLAFSAINGIMGNL